MGTNTKRILLAEDNRSLRFILTTSLSKHYQVTGVACGRALEEELHKGQYDLLITDLNLPDQNGSCVLRRFENLGVGQIPTLIITGMDEDDEQVSSVRRMVNVRDVLFKPVDIHILRSKVDEILLAEPVPNEMEEPVEELQSVLVVDDDPEIRELLSLVFELSGFQVRTCSTAGAALEALRTARFDLVLLDYVLDGESAEDFLARLAESAGPFGVPPILIVSGYGQAMSMDRFAAFPQVKQIVCKPFDADKLVETSRAAIAAAGARTKAVAANTAAFRSGVFDSREALRQVLGDEEVFGILVQSFADDFPALKSQLQHAILRGDAEQTCGIAHKLKGSLGCFRARRAMQLAAGIEELAQAGKMAEVTALYARLAEACDQLIAALVAHRKQAHVAQAC